MNIYQCARFVLYFNRRGVHTRMGGRGRGDICWDRQGLKPVADHSNCRWSEQHSGKRTKVQTTINFIRAPMADFSIYYQHQQMWCISITCSSNSTSGMRLTETTKPPTFSPSTILHSLQSWVANYKWREWALQFVIGEQGTSNMHPQLITFKFIP